MRQFSVAMLVPVLLFGCADQRANQQQIADTVASEAAAWAAECDRKFPKPRKRGQNVPWATCANVAERPMFSTHPYPDLLEMRFATRLALAAKVDKGALSPEDATLEGLRHDASTNAEIERRNTNRMNADTQRAAALAAFMAANRPVFQNPPRTCTTLYGNGLATTSC